MKAIQIVVDETQLARVDRAARRGRESRSAFIRRSIDRLLDAEELRALVEADRAAYAKRPPTSEERAGARALEAGQRRALGDLAEEDGDW